jgi:hypothetical protein
MKGKYLKKLNKPYCIMVIKIQRVRLHDALATGAGDQHRISSF